MKFINQIFLTVFFGSFFVFSSTGSAEVLDLSTVNQSEVVQGDYCVQSSEGSELKAEKALKARKPNLRKKRSFFQELKALFSGLAWMGLGFVAFAVGVSPILLLGGGALFMGFIGVSSNIITGTLLAIPVVNYGIYRFSKALYNAEVRAQMRSIEERLEKGDCSESEKASYEKQIFINNMRKSVSRGLMAGTVLNVFFAGCLCASYFDLRGLLNLIPVS
jgi:hypothetical protein